MLKRKKVTFKETIIKKTVDGQEHTHVREVSVENLSDFPTEQADLQTQYNVYHRARKHIWTALRKICTRGFAFAEFSDTPFGQFIFDLFT